MKDLLILPGHLLTTIAKFLEPGGAKTIVELKVAEHIGGIRTGVYSVQ